MKAFLFGLALTPFFSAAALAQPAQLSESQLDRVTAGFRFVEIDNSNTSTAAIAIGLGPIVCQTCYLNISGPAVSVVANFGTTGVGMPAPVTPSEFPGLGGGGGGGVRGADD